MLGNVPRDYLLIVCIQILIYSLSPSSSPSPHVHSLWTAIRVPPSIRMSMQPCSAALWPGSIATCILYICIVASVILRQHLCNRLWYWAISLDCTASCPLLLTRDSLISTYQVLCSMGNHPLTVSLTC